MERTEPKSRREFLRWIPVALVGVGGSLAAASLLNTGFFDGLFSEGAKINLLKVKVVYFEMGQYAASSDETFHIKSPAQLRDLMSAVLVKHPSMPPEMMNSMLILVNGVPGKMNVGLNEGDEIDLIPLVAGG